MPGTSPVPGIAYSKVVAAVAISLHRWLREGLSGVIPGACEGLIGRVGRADADGAPIARRITLVEGDLAVQHGHGLAQFLDLGQRLRAGVPENLEPLRESGLPGADEFGIADH